VSYGTAPDALTQHAEGGTTADHHVTLTGLTPGQRYHFSVGTARKKLATGTFVMSASPSSSPPVKPDSSPTRSPSPERASPATKPAAAPVQKTPPARMTWGNYGSLQDHFVRHGPDFGSRSAEEYAAQAWSFRQRAYAAGFPMKLDTDGTLRVFDPANGAFAAYNRDGTTKTYFKPGSRDYFSRQPGRPVKPRDLPPP
jgi:pyocin large subunit-like protein